MSHLTNRITELLNHQFVDTNYFLADIKTATNNKKIQVFVDSDTFVTIDECVKISRYLEGYIEDENLAPEKYTLEVSSAGMDSPFKVPRQYAKHINRTVVVVMKDGKKYEGLLHSFDEENLTLEQHKKPKSKKGQIIIQQITLPLVKIKTTKRTITF
ncbi:MAG: ribosome maturation factor RimP [Chitinophagales bacterium]